MTRKNEAAIWRKIGRAFEETATSGEVGPLTRCGLCNAAKKSGLPAYDEPGKRVSEGDDHGIYFFVGFGPSEGQKEAALHRAMSAYLIAEMVMDGAL